MGDTPEGACAIQPPLNSSGAPSVSLRAEELTVGSTFALGSYALSHDDIVDFAREWDPQGFHVDDEIAAAGFFGEVIASGVHSVAVLTKLCVLGAYDTWAVVAGRGMQDLRFLRPVRPGMHLLGTLEIVDVDFVRFDRATVTVAATLTAEADVLVSMCVRLDVWRQGHPASCS